MILKHLIPPLMLVLINLPACSKQTMEKGHRETGTTQNSQDLKAPDIRDSWQWSNSEVSRLNKLAEAGDIKAASRIYEYYLINENKERAQYWEEWLFRRGDRGIVIKRAYQIHKAALTRGDSDPRKLEELREAERLWKSLNPPPEDNVFLEELRSEIAAAKNPR
jgi:hypothetical protein